MASHKPLPSRRSIRLRGYDYSLPGDYFVTICVQDQRCAFGTVRNGIVALNTIGEMVHRVWRDMPIHYSGVELDTFVVMPNHVHGIIRLVHPEIFTPSNPPVGAGPRARPISQHDKSTTAGDFAADRRLSLSDVVQRFKSLTTAKYRKAMQAAGQPRAESRLWQRGYFDRILRNRKELDRARIYIDGNPLRWRTDWVIR